ncbi:MAG: CcdC family protein [Bacillota bacterium]
MSKTDHLVRFGRTKGLFLICCISVFAVIIVLKYDGIHIRASIPGKRGQGAVLLSTQMIQVSSIIVSAMAGIMLITLRIRAGKQPTSLRKIIIPPLGMATGFIMFAFSVTHIPWGWGLSAFGTGMLIFAFPLIVTTRLERVESEIYIRRSKAFIFIMITLFAIRLSLHSIVEQYMSIPQTGAIFYLLAFGMIIPWRLAMVSDYMRLQKVEQ